MEKVKIFSCNTLNTFDGLESDVNKWLAKNGKIEVVSRNMTSGTGVNGQGESFVNCTIAIFYRPLTK